MIRAVIDTNVLVSAMISSAGNEALLLMAIHQGLVAPCLSPEILEEYSEVLTRPRFGFSLDEVQCLLGLLRQRGEMFDPVPVVGISPDRDDDKIISCALAAKADFLVTGNKRHFPPTERIGHRIVNAAELLEIITLEL